MSDMFAALPPSMASYLYLLEHLFRHRVLRMLLRSPFSLQKLGYQARTGTVICRSKRHPVLRRNFEVVSATDWLLPDRGTRSAPAPGAWVSLVCP